MNHQTPFVILSAERGEYDATVNDARSFDLDRQLAVRGYDFSPVTGNYKGRTERAFLVLLDAGDTGLAFDGVVRLAQRYGQESILSVDANRVATFHYLNPFPQHQAISRSERAGKFQHVTAYCAHQLDGWTLDAQENYYAVI